MCTLLAKIRIHPHLEQQFEEVMAYMYRETHQEEGVLRYEYWRGAEPHFYYCLLAFRDSLAFWRHQASDHHEGQMQNLQACIAALELEVVDPVPGASALPGTEDQDLPADEPAAVRQQAETFPVNIPAWWRQAG